MWWQLTSKHTETLIFLWVVSQDHYPSFGNGMDAVSQSSETGLIGPGLRDHKATMGLYAVHHGHTPYSQPLLPGLVLGILNPTECHQPSTQSWRRISVGIIRIS